jgi:hypothetical protein
MAPDAGNESGVRRARQTKPAVRRVYHIPPRHLTRQESSALAGGYGEPHPFGERLTNIAGKIKTANQWGAGVAVANSDLPCTGLKCLPDNKICKEESLLIASHVDISRIWLGGGGGLALNLTATLMPMSKALR